MTISGLPATLNMGATVPCKNVGQTNPAEGGTSLFVFTSSCGAPVYIVSSIYREILHLDVRAQKTYLKSRCCVLFTCEITRGHPKKQWRMSCMRQSAWSGLITLHTRDSSLLSCHPTPARLSFKGSWEMCLKLIASPLPLLPPWWWSPLNWPGFPVNCLDLFTGREMVETAALVWAVVQSWGSDKEAAAGFTRGLSVSFVLF